MSSAAVINALFERTVDIVQSLPKSGAIQTSYEEKLALYSLYKQATEGDVQSKRPGMLDMLGRAKWDAWANRRGVARQDAKQLYVESMLKTLRKFSDRPQAMALIEELESFSGDVAQRVMSASLARVGDSDDSDSDDSEAAARRAAAMKQSPSLLTQQLPLPPSASGAAYDTAMEDDERDNGGLPRALSGLSQPQQRGSGSGARGQHLRPPSGRYAGSTSASVAAGMRSGQRTPLSTIEGASAMAVRGDGHGESSVAESHDDDDDDDSEQDDELGPTAAEARRRHVMPPPHHQYQRGAAPPPEARRTTASAPQPSWQQRSAGSLPGGEGRLYAVPNAARYPGSDAPGGGGGAGASLYSAVGPSARPTPSEQHYYHRHGAPSSVGARSGGGGGNAQRGYGSGVGAAAVRNDVDVALQSIQASLSALHERLNRVEGRGGASGGSVRGANGRSSNGNGNGSSAARRTSPLAAGYRAVADALHDIAVLLGLRSDGRAGPAPSTYRGGDGAESVGSRGTRRAHDHGNGNGSGGGARGAAAGWAAVMRLVVALVQLVVRLTLDLTSIVVVTSVLLLVVKRVTGRGDPLLILRLMRTWLGARVPRAVEAVAAGANGSSGGSGGQGRRDTRRGAE